ncbi:hypothetical protein SAMN05880557_101287 [Pseudacidovorax sp. RU35E]|nr:hypothetical protein SAMN05880557_101287 [Pseudacidovorax sp. RU35E]
MFQIKKILRIFKIETKNLIKIRNIQCGKVTLSYDSSPPYYIKEWYNYCLRLLTEAARASEASFNIVLGEHQPRIKNGRPTYRIALQIEHTLVREGGRDSEGAEAGSIRIDDSTAETYLVRLVNLGALEAADIILDYSRANLINVKHSPAYVTLTKKHFYFVPLINDDASRAIADRTHQCITMFGNPDIGRRKKILEELAKVVPVKNINGIYRGVAKVYQSTKTIINIHQTEHHCNAEELRIVPAALNGAIVIAERSPLTEKIFTRHFAIWASIENIPKVTAEVVKNYPEFYQKMFSEKFMNRVRRLSIRNSLAAKKIINQLEKKSVDQRII